MFTAFSKSVQKIRTAISLVNRYEATEPGMESVYRDLFLRELLFSGITDLFYPVGSAANHSLLYFVARCLRELQPQRVLELGAGQSTLLLDQAHRALGRDIEVMTIEHDPVWIRLIQPQVAHQIEFAMLKPRTVAGRQIEYYDHPMISSGPPIEFLLVDGPPGYPEGAGFSRMGALTIVENRIADDFIIVIDDAERHGEQVLFLEMISLLRRQGRRFRENSLKAIKSQLIVAAGRFERAAYF
jgi:hypothetical protein